MIDIDSNHYPYEVTDLGGAGLVEQIGDMADAQRVADRRRLRLAHQLCATNTIHLDTDGNPTGGADSVEPATWGDGLPGMAGEYDALLGGQGTPAVARFIVEDWSTATGTSRHSARQLLADTLDLVHRFPRTHAKVEALEVEVWRARRLVQDTHELSREAASWIDQQLAQGGSYSMRALDRVIKHGVAKFHPDLLADRASGPGREDWDVTLDHHQGAEGTSVLNATGDSLDLAKFHSAVSDEAATMGRLGDTDTLGQRKAKALGRIADRQATLDLLGLLDPADPESDETGQLVHPETGRPVARRRSYLKARLHLHLTLADLATVCRNIDSGAGDAGSGADSNTTEQSSVPTDHVGVVESNLFGPLTTDLVAGYVKRLGTDIRITPIIDTTREWAVNRHDPPEAMRQQVQARDPSCVFPWCNQPSRVCDLDHIIPFDDTGPPGQTNPENLAPLCRSHHLAKTHGGYTYARNRDGTYTWVNQHGHRWLVTSYGTTRLDTPTCG